MRPKVSGLHSRSPRRRGAPSVGGQLNQGSCNAPDISCLNVKAVPARVDFEAGGLAVRRPVKRQDKTARIITDNLPEPGPVSINHINVLPTRANQWRRQLNEGDFLAVRAPATKSNHPEGIERTGKGHAI